MQSLKLSYSYNTPVIDMTSLERGIAPSSPSSATATTATTGAAGGETVRSTTLTLHYGSSPSSISSTSGSGSHGHAYNHSNSSHMSVDDDIQYGSHYGHGGVTLIFHDDIAWPQSPYLAMDYHRLLTRESSITASSSSSTSSSQSLSSWNSAISSSAIVTLLRRIYWAHAAMCHIHHFIQRVHLYDKRGGAHDTRLTAYRGAVLRSVECVAQSSTRLRLLYRRSNSARADIRLLSCAMIHVTMDQLPDLPPLGHDGRPITNVAPPVIHDPLLTSGSVPIWLLSHRLFTWYRHRGTREILRMCNRYQLS
jgi:hypothetical protein